MAEEHRCQAPRLCVNNCGFFGSPATQNLCSKCYRDMQLKEQQSSDAKQALNQTLSAASSSSLPAAVVTPPAPVAVPSLEGEEKTSSAEKVEDVVKAAAAEAQAPEAAVQVNPNRCLTCKRRVGLTGFKCRCGMTFCGSHRYPEQHGCSFDYRAMGRDQISKANPLVKAEKLDKI